MQGTWYALHLHEGYRRAVFRLFQVIPGNLRAPVPAERWLSWGLSLAPLAANKSCPVLVVQATLDRVACRPGHPFSHRRKTSTSLSTYLVSKRRHPSLYAPPRESVSSGL